MNAFMAKWRDVGTKTQLRLMGLDPEAIVWQVAQFNGEQAGNPAGFILDDDVTPAGVVNVCGYTEAVRLAENMTRAGMHVAYRPVIASPVNGKPEVAEPRPEALLHVMADVSAKLSNGKTLAEHLSLI